ncbi:MAG TPA: AAA family ATPase, partial [Thermoleophilaceae bacterium]|nr:AAA family ATPase [Thermoleophilaceae bacterium]
MHVTRVRLRDFRNYERAEVALGPGLNVIAGANGAGKTNLLEAVYFGLTARSCRTSNEREMVRLGTRVARVEVEVAAEDGAHLLEVGIEPGQDKLIRVDGAPLGRGVDPPRPLVSVFLPDRLDLVKGAPAGRRAHLDRVVAALWPARAATRAAY